MQVQTNFMLISHIFFSKQGPELLEKVGGLHKFMNWKRSLLTVSYK